MPNDTRKQGCTTPIIPLAAHAVERDLQMCFDAGCDDQATHAQPPLTQVLLDTIRRAGFHIGEGVAITEDGTLRSHVNAVDAKTGESFTVMAPTMYEAAVELAEQVGLDLEGG